VSGGGVIVGVIVGVVVGVIVGVVVGVIVGVIVGVVVDGPPRSAGRLTFDCLVRNLLGAPPG
jgi:hypothetical protein